MNRTVMFITFAALAALGLLGSIVLLIHRPDATATFTSFVVQTLGLVAVAAGTFYGLGKANEKLEVVRAQTNGNLTKLQGENKDQARIILDQAAEIATLRATHPNHQKESTS